MDFNPATPQIMHIDINSCFATIEQQANPLLRGRPIVVAAYDSPGGCILAASIEAKRYGVKTGMRVSDGRDLYPGLIVVTPDSDKYRFVHKKLKRLLSSLCSSVYPKSIDEFVLNFESHKNLGGKNMKEVAQLLKQRVRTEIGEWISVSIGIGPNRFLAKVTAGMEKPDGLVEVHIGNFRQIYERLELLDLYGINTRNEARLNSVGIYTVLQMYESNIAGLKAAFHSVNSLYWVLRLRGWEPDDIEFSRKSFGNSHSLKENFTSPRELAPILAKLVNKTATRMRKAGYSAHGVHVGATLKGGGYWHHGERLQVPIFYTSELFANAYRILSTAALQRPVHTLAVTCYDLVNTPALQLSLFEDREKKRSLACAMDTVNNRFGSFVLMTANMLAAGDAVKDRIAFGQGGLS